MKKIISITAISSCLLMQSAYADFSEKDPRALAMGGAVAAAANSAQAPLYNPSLLANAKADEDFNFEIPIAARIADPKDLANSVKDFSDGKYIANFTNAFDSFIAETQNSTINPANLITLQQNLVDASRSLQTGINTLSDKSIIFDTSISVLASGPNQKISWAVYGNQWTDIGAVLNVDGRDNQEMTNFINTVDALQFNDPNSVNNLVNTLLNPVDNFYSSLSINGIQVTEFGVSLAMPTQVNNYGFDVGITPKYMAIKTYDITRTLEESEKNSDVLDISNAKDYSSFNFDVGISKQLNANWKSGVAIKNLLPQSFDTPLGNSFDLKPAIRIGTSYQNNWVTAAVDVDVTKNTLPASGIQSQYIALGTELDVWLLKLRAGYKYDTVTSNNIASLGLGIYLFGLNVDAAVASRDASVDTNELRDVSAALQVGIQW